MVSGVLTEFQVPLPPYWLQPSPVFLKTFPFRLAYMSPPAVFPAKVLPRSVEAPMALPPPEPWIDPMVPFTFEACRV